MYKATIISLMAIVLLLSSCKSTRNLETITIASERGDCMGVAPMRCLLIKRQGQAQWEFLYQEVEGLNYEPGYEYVVEVLKQTIDNPAADQSSQRYILEKVVSKTQKTSEGIPSTNR